MARAGRLTRWPILVAVCCLLAAADSVLAQLPNFSLPSLPGTAGNGGRSRRNYSRMNSQMKQQLVTQLQAQHKTVQQELQELQSQLNRLQGTVEAATSNLKSIREAVQSSQVEVHNALRQLEAAEERVLAAQPEGSPYRHKMAELAAEQRAMEARLGELFPLPPIPLDGTDPEKHFAQNVLRLTPDQRARLKQDSIYAQHAERVQVLNHELEQLKKSLLEADQDWKSAREARMAASERHHRAEEELRQAGGSSAQARRELEAVRERMQQAQAIVSELELELRQLGASPKN